MQKSSIKFSHMNPEMPIKNISLPSWSHLRNAKMIKIRKFIKKIYYINWLKERTI